MLRRTALFVFLCITALLVTMPAFGADPAPTASKDSTKAKWDVSVPHIPSDTLSFDVTEGTWVSLDVSPDGKQLAFDILGDIYTMPITGGTGTLVAGGIPYEIQPRWSPDGKQILFCSDRGGGDNIWVMNADGSDKHQITKESYRLLNNATWHPSGNYVVAKKHFTSGRSMGAGELWMYHVPDGGSGIGLTKRKNDQMDVNEPVFSPDGRYLYWAEDMSPGESFEYNKNPNGTIFVVRRLDMQTNEIKNLISINGGACRPQVSPDGKTISFIRRVRGKSVLSLFNPETGMIKHLWNGLDWDQQETWTLFGVYPGYNWTPDGKSIIIWAKGKIWRVDALTGTPTEIPFKVHSTQVVAKAVRFPQEFGGAIFPVKVIRWPQVTPDGKELVFQALGYLYKKNLATGAQARITSQTDEYEFAPSLSPDGKSIVYVTWNDTLAGRVKIVGLDGRAPHAVVTRPGHYVTAQFSADGNSIVYERGGGDGYRGRIYGEDQGIYTLDLRGANEPKLVTQEGSSPRFSPDGKRILVFSGEGSKAALVSFDLLGSDRRVIATSERAVDFRISPDQKWLAFEELWQAYIVPFPHTNVPVDIGPDMTNLPVKKLSKDGGTFLNWSADSRMVRWSLGPNLYSIPVEQMYPADTISKPKPDSLFVGWNEPADIPNTDLYLVGAKILPMNDLSTIDNGVVHVKGNRIAEVGTKESVKIPAGSRVIDVTGKILMPGIIDTHAHTGGDNNDVCAQRNWSFLSNLAFGVTTMHDPSNNSQMIFAESELLKAGKRIGPRSFSTGTILYGAEGNFKTVINNLDDAISAIKRTAAWGAFSVKSYNQPRREQRQQVIKAAYDLGIEVVPEGGSTLNSNMTQLLDGHTTIEHDIPVAPLYDPELHILGRWNTGYCPTLIVEYGGIFGENYWYQHSEVWKNERLSHFVPRVVLDPRSIRRMMAPDSEYHQFIVSRTVTDVLHRGGNVELGAHGQLQGLGAHWELWMLAQGGMTNHEALRCATWMGARALGLDKLIGSIQPGLLADMIVIDGDVLNDIRQSENVLYTMVNGRLYDSKTLDQLEPVRKPLPKGPNLEGVTGPDVNFDCLGD